jgi:hypothetical protein
MTIKKSFLMVSFIFTILLLMTACQRTSVPEEIESTHVFLQYDDLSDYVGKYVSFYGTIEFAYYTDCDEQIDGDDACPLYLLDSPHTMNIVLGLKRSNITTSGNIIFSDGTQVESDVWGHISGIFTGKVRECDDQKACVIDIYQIDKPEE